MSWRIAIPLLVCAASFSISGFAETIPEGTLLEVRIEQRISSYSTPKGTRVQGVLISPVRQGERTILPVGCKVNGTLKDVRRVGIGLWRETALLEIVFDEIELPGGTSAEIAGRVAEVENSREKVDSKGRIRGILSTATLSQRLYRAVTFVAAVDPIAFLFATAASASLFRFSEPEIYFPPGTEFLVRTQEPFEAGSVAASNLMAVAASPADRKELAGILEKIPLRARTAKSSKPSDMTNLVFIGSMDSLERAFSSAGWVLADQGSAKAKYRAIRSWAESQSYESAPMSGMLLDGRPPDFEFSKALDTFAKRHHLRIWKLDHTWKGQPMWASSATQDTGIGFSRTTKTFVHFIDEHIDNERAKVVNDLTVSRCVDAVDLVKRPWAPVDARNATGDRLDTDRAVAVVELNACNASRRADIAAVPEEGPVHGSLPQRIGRQGILTLRNDLVRGNILFQGWDAIRLIRFLSSKRPERPRREIVVDGEKYEVEQDLTALEVLTPEDAISDSLADSSPFSQSFTGRRNVNQSAMHSDPANIEMGIFGGHMRTSSLSVGPFVPAMMPKQLPALVGAQSVYANLQDSGWSAGMSLTMNSRRYFSQEMGFLLQRGAMEMTATGSNGDTIGSPVVTHSRLMTSQFSYSTVVHATPRGSRFRPYALVGPAIQMIKSNDAPIQSSSSGFFRFGLANVGRFRSVYNFAEGQSLAGGGVFQTALQYGGGIKYRMSRRWTAKIDFRETMSRYPDFFPKSASSTSLSGDGPGARSGIGYPDGPLRQRRLTTGLMLTF